MRALLAGIGIALAATAAQAQWSVSIMPTQQRTIIDFKDQFSDTVSKGQVGVAFSLLLQYGQGSRINYLSPRLRYSYQPQTGGETILLSPPRLIISGVDFSTVQDSSTSTQRKEEEPISIEWSVKPVHSFEVEAGQLGILRPIIAMEAIRGSVSATGKPKNESKIVTATEEFSKTFVGFGARARSYAGRDLWVDAGLVIGSGYESAEVSCSVNLARDFSAGVGYRHRVYRFPGDTTIRTGGVEGSLEGRF